MLINKEKSRKITKLLSLTLATGLMLSQAVDTKAEEIESVRKQKEFHQKQYELQEKIANLSPELYDQEYNDYCDNESIAINGEEHLIADLYIEYGFVDNKKIVYLIDYKDPRVDLITNKSEVDNGYIRRKIILLKYSDVFYEYYHSDKDKPLEEYLYQFEGNINYNVPETYFYNPIFSNEKDKVKSK